MEDSAVSSCWIEVMTDTVRKISVLTFKKQTVSEMDQTRKKLEKLIGKKSTRLPLWSPCYIAGPEKTIFPRMNFEQKMVPPGSF